MDEPTWTPNGDGSLRCKACGCESFRLDQGESCNCRPDGRPALPDVSQTQGGAPVDSTVPLIGALPSIAEYEADLRTQGRDADSLRKRLRRIEEAAAEVVQSLDLMSAGDSWQAARDEARTKLFALELALKCIRAEREMIAENRKSTKDGAAFGKLRALLDAIDRNKRLAAFLRGETTSLEASAN